MHRRISLKHLFVMQTMPCTGHVDQGSRTEQSCAFGSACWSSCGRHIPEGRGLRMPWTGVNLPNSENSTLRELYKKFNRKNSRKKNDPILNHNNEKHFAVFMKYSCLCYDKGSLTPTNQTRLSLCLVGDRRERLILPGASIRASWPYHRHRHTF